MPFSGSPGGLGPSGNPNGRGTGHKGTVPGKPSAQTRSSVVETEPVETPSAEHKVRYNEHKQFADTLLKEIHDARKASSLEKTQTALQELSRENENAIADLGTLLACYNTAETITNFGIQVRALQDHLGHVQSMINDVSTYTGLKQFANQIGQKIRGTSEGYPWPESKAFSDVVLRRIVSALDHLKEFPKGSGSTLAVMDFDAQVRKLQKCLRNYHLVISTKVKIYHEHQTFAQGIKQQIREAIAKAPASNWPEIQSSLEAVCEQLETAIYHLEMIWRSSIPAGIVTNIKTHVRHLRDHLQYVQGPINLLCEKASYCNLIQEKMKAIRRPEEAAICQQKMDKLCLEMSKIVDETFQAEK